MRNALRASLIVATATVGLGAQDRPNFSGVWSIVPSRSVWSDEGRLVNITVFGERFTAEQTQDTLSIAIANDVGFKWIYRLDGVVTRNVPHGPEGPQETSSTTVWRGSALIITTTAVVNRAATNQKRETTRRVSINEDGTLLVEAPWGRNGAMIGSVYSRVPEKRAVLSAAQQRYVRADAQATLSTPATGQVSGRVLDDATHQPLANARVFLYPDPFPSGGRPASTMTNQDGDFAFTALAPGAYRLGTNKLGFFPTVGVGMPFVTLAGSGEHAHIDLTMSRGGALAGRVVDRSGRPLKNVLVGALRVIGPGELEQAIPSVAAARTDGAGAYRVESLQPGQHVIVANPRNGPIAGGTDSRTFFPGTLDFAKAQRVTIGPAQTVAGLDFELLVAPTFEVSGIAVDEAGRPLAGAVVALEADWSLFGGPKGDSRTDPAGHFRIPRLASGRYMLTATRPGEERKPVTRQTPFIRVNVIDADVSGLVVAVPIR